MTVPVLEINATKPIYQQIVDHFLQKIDDGQLKTDDPLPSINLLANGNNLSRDTVMMAYNELKQQGIIKAIPGKGYYIKSTNTKLQKNLFLLFDELNGFKEDLYQAFMANIPPHFNVDLFFHHFNKGVYEKLIGDNKNAYHKYIIMPSNMPGTGKPIDELPQDKVILLDQPADGTNKAYPIIYQSFHEDIFNGLKQAVEKIRNYHQLILLFPGGKEPLGFQTGFTSFCTHHQLKHQVCGAFDPENMKPGNLYLCIDNRDLISVVKEMRQKNLTIGQQVGIISINDTALLEIIEGGIAAISTDFREMGRRLAQMVTNNETGQIKNPSRLIVRNSL